MRMMPATGAMWRTDNRLSGDIGGRAGVIFYDDRLTKPLRKPLTH
jgi:hypothetical protein